MLTSWNCIITNILKIQNSEQFCKLQLLTICTLIVVNISGNKLANCFLHYVSNIFEKGRDINCLKYNCLPVQARFSETVWGRVREIVHTMSHFIPLTVFSLKSMSLICFERVFEDLRNGNSVGNNVYYFRDYFRHAVTFRADWIYSSTMGAWVVRNIGSYNC